MSLDQGKLKTCLFVEVERSSELYIPAIRAFPPNGSGTKIGQGTKKAGMAQPVIHWTPSIAPSGMDFYTGDAFPGWRGNLFVGALKYRLLVRLVLQDDRVVHQERLLEDWYAYRDSSQRLRMMETLEAAGVRFPGRENGEA